MRAARSFQRARTTIATRSRGASTHAAARGTPRGSGPLSTSGRTAATWPGQRSVRSDMWGTSGMRVDQRAQAVAQERLHGARAFDLDRLQLGEHRQRDRLAVAHEPRGPQVFLEQVVERPRHHVAVGPRGVLGDAAHVDDQLLERAQRRPRGRSTGARAPARGRSRAGSPRPPRARRRRARSGFSGVEAHVHERALRLDRGLHHAPAEPRGQRARPRGRARA